jgi:HD-GYP domain-containing protein (c-di-GMP phosphodiesterase class II)
MKQEQNIEKTELKPELKIDSIKQNKKRVNIHQLLDDVKEQSNLINELLEIGQSLSIEHNLNILLENILFEAKKLTNADGGTLYLMSDDKKSLEFTVIQTDSLDIKMGGTADKITWPALKLYDENNDPNNSMVAVVCALEGKLIKIDDVYNNKKFNFEGAKKFDEANNYRTKSMIVIPMKNHEDEIIGVLQLLNKQKGQKEQEKKTISFANHDSKISSSLASQAAVAISNTKLIKSLEDLLDSFIQTIAMAIDTKSKYTGGHISRVAKLSNMLAEAINDDKTGIYKDKNFSKDEIKEINISAWMHDIGKITTPEYIVDKATKLETIHDRISEIEVRFELLKNQREIEYLKMLSLVTNDEEILKHRQTYKESIKQIDDDFEFIKSMNFGGEFMSAEYIDRVKKIASYQIKMGKTKQNILNENEIENLCIKKGTLLDDERLKINEHATMSFKMLEPLPFPPKLQRVPAIASGHHEKICGGGYPLGLKGDEITFEMRILAIADIFEALTASDRPYKKPNSLNKSLEILSYMVKDGELDADMVKFFVDSGLYLKYADEYLLDEQKDEITVKF